MVLPSTYENQLSSICGQLISHHGREGAFLDKGKNGIYDRRGAFRKEAAAWTDLMVDGCMKAQNTVKSRILFVEEIW